MTTNWQRSISRRQLLSGAITGAAAVPAHWILFPTSALAASNPTTPAAAFDATVPTAWFELVGDLVTRTPGYTPPVASRAFGCIGIGLYEAVLPGMPDHVSLAGNINQLGRLPATGRSIAYHWPTVANAAMAAMTRSLFPTAPADLRSAVDALESRFVPDAPRGVVARSIERGRAVAAAVDAWSRTDGGHEGYLRNFPGDYVAPVGPGLWTPTAPGFLPALQPHWGRNRCMVLDSAGSCDPGPHPAFSTDPGSPFFAEAVEAYETVNALTPAQREIALFWADDPGLSATPPGHSVSIMTQLLRTQERSLAFAAEAYARLGMAVCDAFITCWWAKYRHNLLRPITYIREHIDPAWGDPLPVTTPPFPEYTSGHSVQSGAAAEVLTATFGTVAFTDHTHDARGFAPRTFASFHEAADEAAISRLYGGIHYRAAIERGLEQGRCVGAEVVALRLRQ